MVRILECGLLGLSDWGLKYLVRFSVRTGACFKERIMSGCGISHQTLIVCASNFQVSEFMVWYAGFESRGYPIVVLCKVNAPFNKFKTSQPAPGSQRSSEKRSCKSSNVMMSSNIAFQESERLHHMNSSGKNWTRSTLRFGPTLR